MPPRPFPPETDPRIVALSHKFADGHRRLTKQRVKLLEAILSLDAPATVPEIYERMGSESCDYVTVYRSLLAMERLGILQRVYAGYRGACFTLTTIPETLFVFSKGDAVSEKIELPRSLEIDDAVRRVEENLRSLGYTGVSHVIQFSASRPGEAALPPEPAQTRRETQRPTTKPRKPKKPTRAELAAERVAAFMRQRFGAER